MFRACEVVGLGKVLGVNIHMALDNHFQKIIPPSASKRLCPLEVYTTWWQAYNHTHLLWSSLLSSLASCLHPYVKWSWNLDHLVFPSSHYLGKLKHPFTRPIQYLSLMVSKCFQPHDRSSPLYSSIHPHSHTLKLIIYWYWYTYVYSNIPIAIFWLQLPISPDLSFAPSFLRKVLLHLMVISRLSIPSFSFILQIPSGCNFSG